MTARTFHTTVCIIIIGLLFFDSFARIEFAATKNRFLTTLNKEEINGMKDLTEIKKYAKGELDKRIEERCKESNLALLKFGCLLLLSFSIIKLAKPSR